MISHQMGMLVHFSLHLDSLNRFFVGTCKSLRCIGESFILLSFCQLIYTSGKLHRSKYEKWFANKMDRSGYNHIADMCVCAAHQISHAHVHVCHVHGCARFKRNLISLFVYAEGIFCCFIYDCFEYC